MNSSRARNPLARPDPEAQWVKSRWSQPGGECVELAALPDATMAIRSSGYPDGLWLLFSREEMQAFIHSAKAGAFDDIVRMPENPARPCRDAAGRAPTPSRRKDPQRR